VNLYCLLVHIEHNGDESPKDLPPCFTSAHFPISPTHAQVSSLHVSRQNPVRMPPFPPKPMSTSFVRSVAQYLAPAQTVKLSTLQSHSVSSYPFPLRTKQPPQTPQPPSPLSPLSPLFSYTLSICSSLNVSDLLSNPHKTGEIIQTLSAPTNTLYYTLCVALLICGYMFRHNCHLHGAYKTVSQ